MSAAALAVLMRWPRRGEGKSRLAASLGVGAAHALHRAFVADTLAWPWDGARVLAVAGDDVAVAAARFALPDALVVAQWCGDLGARIAGALSAGFDTGAASVVLVGTDSPSLPAGLVLDCVRAAESGGAAMVAAEDGGFVALALHRAVLRRRGLDWLGDGIAWSTGRTGVETRSAAARAGLEIAVVGRWYDVDTAADLARLHADLRAAPSRAPRTLRRLGDLAARRVEELAS